MSWDQLAAVTRDATEELNAEKSGPPSACPNDGEPLLGGPRGELVCPFDGWRWSGVSGPAG